MPSPSHSSRFLYKCAVYVIRVNLAIMGTCEMLRKLENPTTGTLLQNVPGNGSM